MVSDRLTDRQTDRQTEIPLIDPAQYPVLGWVKINSQYPQSSAVHLPDLHLANTQAAMLSQKESIGA